MPEVPTTDWTSKLVKGLAEYLHDAGVGNYVEDEGAPVTSVPIPIVRGPIPDKPDHAIGLIAYTAGGAAGSEDTQLVQVWIRGDTDRDTALGTGDELYQALHGAEGLVLGDVPVTLATRRSVVPMGRDDRGRWEFAHNYALLAAHPSPFTDD